MRALTEDWLLHEPGAEDFAAICLEHFDRLADQLEVRVSHHAVLGPLVAAMTEEQRATSREVARSGLREALAGRWEVYAESLRQHGTRYAALGLASHDWSALATVWSRLLVPVLVERLCREPGRLTAALVAMQALVDATMGVLGETYSAASSRRHERELQHWEALFQSIPWGICATDANGQVIELANEAFARAYGSDSRSMRGRTLASLYEPEELARITAIYSPRARQTGETSFETVHVRTDGSSFPVQVEAARIPGLDGGKAWALHIRDLTERHQIEALSVRGAELEAENRRVQEASRLKSEFLANMSHELRTPLNSILGFSELLHAGDVGTLTETQHDFVGDIHTSGQHLLRLINDVLDLSKVEAGKMQFFPESASLRGLIEEVTGVLRGVASARQVTLEIAVAEGLDEVYLDTVRLKQVLYNFLSNAIKFSPPRGRVVVSARPEGDVSFRIEVSDQGAGIAVADQGRLFKEFEQLDAGRTKSHGGTGLGLALTRRLVEAQGGAVGVESAEGAGSVFYAVLPCHSSVRSLLPQPRRIAGPRPDAPRVLVIEDDASDQERVVTALLGAGYAVDTATTGAQALRAASERDYEAITLDLVLPDTNGFTVLAALRRQHRSRKVPVIVISLLSEKVDAGFVVHDVLQKPLQPESLLSSLQRASITPPGDGPILVVDDDEPSSHLMVASLHQLGFRAVVAHDGQQALERARQEIPMAVVLDIVMPQLDGFGFLQRFRAEPRWGEIPVLIWTGKDLSPEEQRTLLQHAGAVLAKDGSGVRTVAEVIRRHLPAQRGVSP